MRNDRCEFINARSARKMIWSPLIAECQIVLQGLQTTSTLGVQKLVIEGDSLQVIDTLYEDLEDCPKRN